MSEAKAVDLRFKALGPMYKRDSVEWPDWVKVMPDVLTHLSDKLCHWRDADLVEFTCTNGRAFYRIEDITPTNGYWVLRREYEESW